MNITLSTIELFHLLFLRQLGERLDKQLYALKGGCNLRFFLKSIRYSEDIDFDVTTIAMTTLKNKINKILESTAFQKILQSKSIEILQHNPTKQTETTQRWKLLLRSTQTSMSIPTKIEFSRRKIDQGTLFEAIDQELISHHHIYPILCNHYDIHTAFSQKILALINRTETQTRDLFDLKWLLDQGIDKNKIPALSNEKLQIAIENASQLHYADYKGQVVAFLMDEYKDFYGTEIKWHAIQNNVITFIKENLLCN